MGEKKIIIAGSIILVVGVVSAAANKKPLDKPIVGGLGVMLILGVIAAGGTRAAAFAGDFAMLALLAVLLAQAGTLLKFAP